MRILIFMMLIHLSSMGLHAQEKGKVYFSTEFITKFPVGKEVTESIQFDTGFIVDYPVQSRFNNPAFSLEFGPSLELGQSFIIGIVAGLVLAANESKLNNGYAHFDRVMIPLLAHFSYKIDLGKDFYVLPKYKIGHQSVEARYGYDKSGLIVDQKGGLLMALDVGISQRSGKSYPFLNIGYELTMIHNRVNLGELPGYDFSDKFEYNTAYHFITLGAGVEF